LKVNPKDYKHIIFVDASGDDGAKYDSGSSLCFCVGCFYTTIENYEHNINILAKIKKESGRLPNQELKYVTLRKYKNKEKALELLESLKGYGFVYNACKKLSPEQELTAFTHTFPLYLIAKALPELNPAETVVVIDRMKQKDMDETEHHYKLLDETTLAKYSEGITVIFRDSKDSVFPLIQIADIFSGIGRSFFENNYDMVVSQGCKICKTKRFKKCTREGKFVEFKDFKQAKKAIYSENNNYLLRGVLVHPIDLMDNVWFVNCI